MWPWEHLAVGYLWYSVAVKLAGERSPTNAEAITLLFATQFPDLVDKPLSWVLNVLPSGLSLAHSLFFAAPAVAVVLALSHRLNATPVGLAFGLGYATHLLGDVAYPFLLGRPLIPKFLLWPIYSQEANVTNAITQVIDLTTTFVNFLGTPTGQLYIVFEAILMVSFLVRWLFDGRPGWPYRGYRINQN